MILGVLTVLVLGTFGPLMWMASAGSRGAAVAGSVEAFLFVAGAAVASFYALVFFGFKCDEACDENIAPEAQWGTWWHTLDAWQWKAQLALGVASFLAALIGFSYVRGKRYRAAMAAVGTALALFCAWALLVAPLGSAFGI